jgi:hypothetical protein
LNDSFTGLYQWKSSKKGIIKNQVKFSSRTLNINPLI